MRVLVTGASGLVGQNLVPRLKAKPGVSLLATDKTAIEKHAANNVLFRKLHPDVTLIEADIADAGAWTAEARTCGAEVMLHAQIGGLRSEEFERNNITATKRVLEALAGAASTPCVRHVSGSAGDLRAKSPRDPRAPCFDAPTLLELELAI